MILSNVEFEKLVSDQSFRLKALAQARTKDNPIGSVELKDVDGMLLACRSAGDQPSYYWLSSLRTMITSGQLQRIRAGSVNHEDHLNIVHQLYAQKKLPFDVFDSVFIKDEGKRGKIVDYVPRVDKYVVVLNPFEARFYPPKELERIATKVDPGKE